MDKEQIKFTHIAVANMFNVVQQDLFSSSYIDDLRKSLEPIISARVGRFGIDINDIECRVLEAILKGFTETSFEGNYKSISKKELSAKINTEIDLESTHLEKFPRLRFTQKKLMDDLGVSRSHPGAISRAVSALDSLSSKMFTFFYARKVVDEKGDFVLNKDGSFVYEHVVAQGTLLTLLRVKDESESRLKNYEVVLNPLFIDEREENCLIIPSDWRQEVSSVVGNKKTSSYVFKFLIFLRYIHEFFAKKNTNPPFVLEITMEEMAVTLKFPESSVKRQKKRTESVLENCYFVAKSLGYLEDYSLGEYMHRLVLNEKKYFLSAREEEKKLLTN